MSKKPKILVICLVLLWLLLFASVAHAHKAAIKVEVKEGKVLTQSFYTGKEPMKNAKIRVYDSTGKQLLEGKTDEQGKSSFDVPKDVESLKVVVQDLLGHRAEVALSKEELHNE